MRSHQGPASAAASRRVAVTSDHSLLADTVSAALAGPGLSLLRLPWNGEAELHVPPPRGEPEPVVGVMLCDLHPLARLAEAQRIIVDSEMPWLVLTAARRGPLWGALLEAGAYAVARSTMTLGELRRAIDRVAVGPPLMREGEVSRLVRSWRALLADHGRAVENLRSLSPREAEVLSLMHAGLRVSRIADRLDVSETTVRSQVRAVLVKLGVRSQLGAVAAYEAASAQLERVSLD